MSLLGKILAVLNLLAAGGFLYLAVLDYSIRQQWSYALFRHDIALLGMPVDREDRDDRGRPRYLAMNEALAEELAGSRDALTQEDALDLRRTEVLARVDDENAKSSIAPAAVGGGVKVAKYVEVLLPLAGTA